jgi:ABC-2 type transport system permease protein
MSFRRYLAVARKEFVHILRDPRSLLAALAMPFMLLLLFGYALTLDVDRIPTAIYDRDRTPQSRELAAQFNASRFFEVSDAGSDGYRTIERGIDRNRILLGVVIPAGYAADLLAGGEASVQLLIDGSDSNTASIALGYAEALVAAYSFQLRSAALDRRGAGELTVPVEGRVRVWYNSELESRNYIIPGLIAVILMIIAAMLTSLTIAREWELGTMEQLLSTPVRPAELVLGKLTAYFTLGVVDMLISIATGVLVFGVPLRGNALLLFGTGCIFLFGALAWGILLSAATRSQLMAYQLGLLSSFLPAFLLSGFIFAIENMPFVIQVVTYAIPSRYFVEILKGIFLKGVGLEVLWAEILLLAVYGVVVFAVAVRRMRAKVA